MTALVKGSLAKRSRAKPFNDWAVPAYITAGLGMAKFTQVDAVHVSYIARASC